MPLNVPITEEMVRGLAPDDKTWQKAEELAGSDRLMNTGVSSDGTWLLADAKDYLGQAMRSLHAPSGAPSAGERTGSSAPYRSRRGWIVLLDNAS